MSHLRRMFTVACALAVMAGAVVLPAFAAAPLPESARGPAIDQSKGYLVQEVRDGLYWLTNGSYQAMFLTTGQGVILVDTPPSMGQFLLKAIAEVTQEPITHLVYSHAHKDHIGAAGVVPKGVTIVAQEETAAALREANDPNRPVPTVTFSDAYTLTVGSQTLELSYKGPNHTPGNIFIYAPKQKVLMLVDVIFPGWTPFMNLAVSEDVPGFYRAHDQALAYDFDTFIGGHVNRLGTRADVEAQKAYVTEIRDNAAAALKEVTPQDIGAKTGFENPWYFYDTYLNAVATDCAGKTVPDWLDKLGAVDVWTHNHCLAAVLSMNVD